MYYGDLGASQVALVVKNPPVNAGDVRDVGLIPGLGRFPRKRKGYPFQYSDLENSIDYNPQCHKESDTTKRLSLHFSDINNISGYL